MARGVAAWPYAESAMLARGISVTRGAIQHLRESMAAWHNGGMAQRLATT